VGTSAGDGRGVIDEPALERDEDALRVLVPRVLATAYAEAARRATNVAERDHLVRQSARVRAALMEAGSSSSASRPRRGG
jgi:hypothetical protein